MGYYEDTGLTAIQRDEMIVDLRRRGYTYRQIAPRVGMSAGGVLRALRRIGEGARAAPEESPRSAGRPVNPPFNNPTPLCGNAFQTLHHLPRRPPGGYSPSDDG